MPGDFLADTAVERDGDRFRAALSPQWEVWGPLGGYVAAIGLRALGAASDLPRPASFQCLFLSVGHFGEVDVDVTSLRRGRRSEALSVHITQEGRPVLAGTGWVVEDGMDGLEHEHARMPEVPRAEELASYADLAEDYDQWFPVWRAIDGRPVLWLDEPSPPVWHTWMRLFDTPKLTDPFLEAARQAMWMDLMMWNAAAAPHTPPWPPAYMAPNLDLSVVFHAGAPDDEWLLCDSHAPVGRHGLVGCTGRVWSPSGRLLASGTSTLLCRPVPAVVPAESDPGGGS